MIIKHWHHARQAAIDPVGGQNLPYIVKRLDNNGSVAVIGMTGGNEFESSIFPFILRGVSIIGIDSVFTPISYVVVYGED